MKTATQTWEARPQGPNYHQAVMKADISQPLLCSRFQLLVHISWDYELSLLLRLGLVTQMLCIIIGVAA